MEIIIVGAGRVGYRLAKALSLKHDVTMIDRNREALERIAEQADIFTITGDAENPDTYRMLWGKEVDLFIAVADRDEVNITACLIADESIRSGQKIIRFKNSFFAKSGIAEKIGVTEAVFPVSRIASALNSLMHYPRATSVKSIAASPFKLMAIRVQNDSTEPMMPLASIASDSLRFIGIERDKRLEIVRDDTVPLPGDLLYICGDPEEVSALCSRLNTHMPSKIKNIVIFGADTIGTEIARTLSRPGITIKLIDRDAQACEKAAAELLDRVTVINGRYGEHRLFEDEGLKNADMLIASTGRDEENIIKCVEAMEHGIERAVAINDEAEYYQLMHNLGIVAARGAKVAAYHAIMERINSSAIVIGKQFCGNSGTMFIRRVNADSVLIGRKEIQPFEHPECICFVLRGRTLIPFRGPLTGIERDDLILAFCLAAIDEKVKKWIHSL